MIVTKIMGGVLLESDENGDFKKVKMLKEGIVIPDNPHGEGEEEYKQELKAFLNKWFTHAKYRSYQQERKTRSVNLSQSGEQASQQHHPNGYQE
jgi:hypothetical protein